MFETCDEGGRFCPDFTSWTFGIKRMEDTLGRIRTVICQGLVVSIAGFFIGANAMEPTLNADQIRDQQPRNFAPNALQGPSVSGLIIKYREGTEDMTLERAAAAADRYTSMSGVSVNSLETLATGSKLLSFQNAIPLSEAQAIADNIAANDPNVLYAEPDALMQIQQPNDTRFGEQWHLFEPDVGINLPGSQTVPAGEREIIVAVIDTGILPHEDIEGRVLPGYDFIKDPFMGNDGNGRDGDATDSGDSSDLLECGPFVPSRPANTWHGLHVSGTVAAITNNNLGVAGVSDNVKVLPVRVLGKCGGRISDIVSGMLWAVGIPIDGVPDNPNPAQVLNLSLGGSGGCGPSYADALRKIRQLGATVVVAAGNADRDASEYRPANCEGVITVAATNRAGALASFGNGAGSNYGSVVDISAPGGETHSSVSNGILSTLNSGTIAPASDVYGFYQGTSMAAPHVAGVAALLYQANLAIESDEVLDVLQRTSRAFLPAANRPCNVLLCGAGLVDATAALQAVAERQAPLKPE